MTRQQHLDRIARLTSETKWWVFLMQVQTHTFNLKWGKAMTDLIGSSLTLAAEMAKGERLIAASSTSVISARREFVCRVPRPSEESRGSVVMGPAESHATNSCAGSFEAPRATCVGNLNDLLNVVCP